ncbi:MAG: flippase-like domain-containing protein [Dehalococcoidia bacterium]|nr:flippase-like domain-containing protein [Dehalococcoidia bacterium]
MASSAPAAPIPPPPSSSSRLRRHLALSIALAVIVSVAVAVSSNLGEVTRALADLSWRWLALAITLGLAAHSVRFVRWHWLLARVTRPPEELLSLPRSGQIHAAGVAMQMVPGWFGEWVKSYYVHALRGAPASRTAPIILVERITDTLGLALLATAGLLVYRTAFLVVGASVAISVAMLLVLVYRPAAQLAERALSRVPLLMRFAPHVEDFYGAASDLLTFRSVPVLTAVAYVSWLFEALAYWCILRGLGVEGTWTTVYLAAFIWPVATLAGGLLLTPGGVGVAEGGLTALASTLVEGFSRGPAAAAALASRAVTLWLGTAIGLAAMLLLSRRLRDLDPPPAEPDAVTAPAPDRART